MADEALQNSKSLVDATLESIHNGILVINQQGAVIKTNARFAELWHIPKSLIDEADDKTLLDFVLEQLADPDEFIKKITELYGKPESVGFELIYFKDGRVFERISKPIHNEYEQKGRVWSFLDITDRKRYEEELKYKNKELQKLNTEKDKFFSVLAHDLRSPFNSLLGFTQLLIEDLPTMTEAQIYKIALTMRRSAINLFRLLENLLEWSRIQRGLIAFNPEPRLLMPKVLADTALVMESANKKEITLNYNIPEELEVYADENMLGSILRNLAGNAVKFSPKGGKVTISAKQLHNAVECSVSDTGIGMNQEMKENLFNIDVNTNRKGTEKEPSTGLGLIICKEFVEKHGGRLWVESEEGKGSTFYFTLHFTTEYKPEEVITKVVSAGNAAGQSRKLKILIVEDDEISDSLISIMVEKYGKEIIHSITGIKALEACRKNPDLDLVLMDINLPEIDGFEATRQIRQFNKDVIIIAQTAYSNDFPDFRQKLTDAGCNDYILKPIDHNELKGLIRKYFSF